MKQFTTLLDPCTIIDKLKYFTIPALGFWLVLLATPVQATCQGCLCPGDPCKLCPLPAMVDETPKPDEHDLCVRIREKIPPTTAQPGSDEYFPILDRSIATCVSEGGDVIRNRRRNAEFTSRFYCKPPTPVQPR